MFAAKLAIIWVIECRKKDSVHSNNNFCFYQFESEKKAIL